MDATLPPPDTEPPLRRVGGRWRVGAPIGRGSFGSVWRATDEATGAAAAVKILGPEASVDLARARKEVAALRLLRVPGVVELLDAGTEDGRPWLAMELVPGLPFPGHARGWDALAPLVARLAETLRQIHAHGVVHRDLKPSNVLVTDEGRVVVLDFGVARGAALGSTVTGSAEVVGTPLYLAPEQVHRDAPVDGRADLYALGLLIYEALAGRRPFAGRTAQEILIARLTRDAPPLDAPGVPEHVARLVAGLLARDPARRPSADEVLAALQAGDAAPLPWLGSRAPVDALVEAARAGRSRDVWGPPGSGKSRVLAEVSEALRGGREVALLVPAERPLESLAPLTGALGDDAPMAAAEARLVDALRRGVTVVADDAARLDRWSRALLERARGAGSVLRVAPGPDAVRVEGVTEEDLRALFHGPDVVLHLREDAARALFARTGGVPARVAEEVRAWVARGDARWDDGRLRVDRRAIDAFAAAPAAVFAGRVAEPLEEPLDELLAWVVLASGATREVLVAATGLPPWEIDVELGALEEAGAVRRLPDGRLQALTLPRALGRWTDAERARVHRKLADAVPAEGRLVHLVAAGEPIDGAAVTFAQSLLETGAAGKALATLHLAVSEARAAARAADPGVLVEMARAALVDGSGPALREARVALERAGTAELAALVAGWEAAGERRYRDAEAAVGGLGRFPDEELDAWRVALPVRVAVATDLEEAERRIAGLEGVGGVVGRRRIEWLGHLRYRQRRFVESAELHTQAANAESGVARKANALINAGLAWRDAYRLEEALVAFGRARQTAGMARLAVLEGHAVVGERTASYRLERPLVPDPDAIDAIAALGDPRLLAPACLNEAAIAWRNGHAVLAERLARQAAMAWDNALTRNGWLLASALACASGARREEAGTLLSTATSTTPAEMALQALALLRTAGADVDRTAVVHVLERVGDISDLRREVLTLREATTLLGELG